MAETGLTIIDGSHLRSPILRLPIIPPLTGSQLIDFANSEAAARLFGLPLPESLRSTALQTFLHGGHDGFLSSVFHDQEMVIKKVRDYLMVVADLLKDDPLVISVLDGTALQLFLDDEDDFAMMAENLFTELDVDDNGKLNKNEIPNALERMGVVMGVPPFSESGDLLNNILKKHGGEGGEQLGQAQFAQLLQPILLDLADALAEKPVAVLQNIRVANGSKLKKVLADDKAFEDVIGVMFQEWVAMANKDRNKGKMQSFFEAKGPELGLPRSESSEAVELYNQVFSSIKEEIIGGDLSKDAFREVVKGLLMRFAEQLEMNPVFID